MQAVFHSKHASAVEIEVKIVKGEIQFYDLFSWQYVKTNDILEVSYPSKNQAEIILENGKLLIKAPNIRGTLNHFLGSFNEKLSRSERLMKRGLGPFILLGFFLLASILLFYFFYPAFACRSGSDELPQRTGNCLRNRVEKTVPAF